MRASQQTSRLSVRARFIPKSQFIGEGRDAGDARRPCATFPHPSSSVGQFEPDTASCWQDDEREGENAMY